MYVWGHSGGGVLWEVGGEGGKDGMNSRLFMIQDEIGI